jgi:ABC-type transport system involved in cytochrome c biogenesis ATPase subunit
MRAVGDRVGGQLTRHELVAAGHAALSGRYVEIRGDAGVGKSGLLKHFAGRLRPKRRSLYSPSRTTEADRDAPSGRDAGA